MATITPFVKRMRTQGGTIYTFSSALEDIGLNINERNNIVKMSHYALLNIPDIGIPSDLVENKFNVFAIPGAYESFSNSGNIKDSRVIVAESFQNYALNLETNLLSQSTYNPALQDTISERVFWKWLKETGAVRWEPIDTSAGLYWKEDTSSGYSSVVQAIGQISAGSVRTDTFGTYNETYVLVPTSHGKMPVYFKQVEDDNYYHGLAITDGNTNILGRENYLKPHPDALDIQAYYDLADSSALAGDATLQYLDSNTWVDGWWWSLDDVGVTTSTTNSYLIDTSAYIADEIYYNDLQLFGGSNGDILLRRSKVDCLSIEYDLTNLRTIFNDTTLTFDNLAINLSEDDEYDFNAVLIYYSVYNKSLDTILATNLLGILFLDAPSGNTTQYGVSDILLPSITKLQSGPSGFGTSYSFRLNVKSDYMLDDTAATIIDESTSAQTALENFSQVFDSLNKTLSIMNQHTGTINYITSQYIDITSNQTGVLNQITDLENRLNNLEKDISGPVGNIPMFSDGTDPLVESSIYMSEGKIGFFTDNPMYPAQFDVSVKVKDLIIENAVRDTSGYILLGYGSPLQIGSSENDREIAFYSGSGGPLMTFSQGKIQFSSTATIDGGIQSGVSKAYVDGSLALYVKEASLNTTYFKWIGGQLVVDVSVAGGGVSYSEFDSSISALNSSFTTLSSALNDVSGKVDELDEKVDTYDSSIGNLNAIVNDVSAKLKPYDSSINALNSSFTTLSSALNDVSGKVDELDEKVDQYDASIAKLDSSLSYYGTSISKIDASLNTFVTNTKFDASLNELVLEFDSSGLVSRVDALESSIGILDSKVDELDSKVDTYDTSLGTLTTWSTSFDSSIGTLTTKVSTTDSSLSILTTKVSTTDSSLSKLTIKFDASFGELTEETTTTNSKTVDLSTYVTNLNTNVQTLTTRYNATEASLGPLTYTTYNASLGAINSSINDRALKILPDASVVLSTSSAEGIFGTFTAGATIGEGGLVYVQSTGRVALADADSSSMMPAIAINPTSTVTSGSSGSFLLHGIIKRTTPEFTVGKPVYVGLNGFLTSTKPTAAGDCVQVVGIALSSNTVLFNPSLDFIVLK